MPRTYRIRWKPLTRRGAERRVVKNERDLLEWEEDLQREEDLGSKRTADAILTRISTEMGELPRERWEARLLESRANLNRQLRILSNLERRANENLRLLRRRFPRIRPDRLPESIRGLDELAEMKLRFEMGKTGINSEIRVINDFLRQSEGQSRGSTMLDE